MSDYEKEIDSLIHYIKAPEHTHLEAKQALIELMAKARVDELEGCLSAYNNLEEYRHNPCMELKPGNMYTLDRIAELSSNKQGGK